MLSTAVGKLLTASVAAAISGFVEASSLRVLTVLTGKVTTRRTRSRASDETRKLPRWGVAMNTTRLTYGTGLKKKACWTNASDSGDPFTSVKGTWDTLSQKRLPLSVTIS